MVLHALTSLTYVVVAVARSLRYIGDYVKPMESFVDSLTPQRVGKCSVQAFYSTLVDRPCRFKGLTEYLPEARARESQIDRGLSFASVRRWKSNFQYVTCAVLIVEPSMAT